MRQEFWTSCWIARHCGWVGSEKWALPWSFAILDYIEWLGLEKYQKRKRKLNIYTAQTRTQLRTDKKGKKETYPSTFFSIYIKKIIIIKINNLFFGRSNSFLRSWLDGKAHFCRGKYAGTSSALGPETFKSRLQQNSFSCSGFHVWITSKGSSSRLISYLHDKNINKK